jgi:hypothetical protein
MTTPKPADLKKLINKQTLLLAFTLAANAVVGAIASPSPQELNLTPRPVISTSIKRTIASIACEGASNGLTAKDLQIDVYAQVLRASTRYSPKEFQAATDRIVKKSEDCSPRQNNQLTAKN